MTKRKTVRKRSDRIARAERAVLKAVRNYGAPGYPWGADKVNALGRAVARMQSAKQRSKK
jgi:hypothetical protein